MDLGYAFHNALSLVLPAESDFTLCHVPITQSGDQSVHIVLSSIIYHTFYFNVWSSFFAHPEGFDF